ncbi:hypothetical protein BJ322DRAFT_1208839 [Thelephora terrestris]|uniref:DUF6533 domain-containing protein n=1 Tax=Thelephora terrestris TaxID=56493 RepID=A0A9P6L9W7_9AGAM|nr:hypothetical protein BJ322DRAFT_1208839 [Thelephora terrestris]
MSSELDPIVQAGRDILAFKYYGLATGTILFYDYLLTLEDEIKYMWSRKQSWTFWLFVVNRYFPMTYQIWQLAISYNPLRFATNRCNKTAWYVLFTYTICTLLAQVVLTSRIYAATMNNTVIAIVLLSIVVPHFGLGIWEVVLASREGAELSPIPLDAYRVCSPVWHRPLVVSFISISLVYDSLAFSMIMFLAARSSRATAGLKIQTIWRLLAEDATLYFMVIFTSHFVFEMTLLFGRPTIQLIPGVGGVSYIPVMISRIVLSLRKATALQQNG